jgi:hypothetical protein
MCLKQPRTPIKDASRQQAGLRSLTVNLVCFRDGTSDSGSEEQALDHQIPQKPEILINKRKERFACNDVIHPRESDSKISAEPTEKAILFYLRSLDSYGVST